MLIAEFQVCCLTCQLLKKTCLLLTKPPFQKQASPSWRVGVPTPLNEGSLTPNQEAIGLLAGFASGSI